MAASGQVFDEAMSVSELVHPNWSYGDRVRFARAAAQFGDRAEAGVFRPSDRAPKSGCSGAARASYGQARALLEP